MNDFEKDFKKFRKKIRQHLDESWEQGYDTAQISSGSYDDGYMDGANAERERIKKIFDMNIKWALESNKGSDVVFFTKAKEIIEPVDVDYSDEAYQRMIDEDGF